MSYKIIQNGMLCIEGAEEKTWKMIYNELENGKTPSFILDLNNLSEPEDENDDLAWLLNLGLCMWIHWEKKFFLDVRCPYDKKESAGNKFANFLRFFIENGRLQLTINRYVKTTRNVKNEVPDAYFPMMVVDQEMYKKWFLKPLSADVQLKEVLCGTASEENSGECKVDFYLDMAMKVCRKMLFSRSGRESEGIKKRLQEICEEQFKDHCVMTVLLSCILYNRFRKGVRLTSSGAILLLKKMVHVAYIYKLGLQEVCENILKHTEQKRGIFYLRTLSERKTKHRFASVSNVSPECLDEDEIFKSSNRWLEMAILDAGEKGILETQKISGKTLEEIFKWSNEIGLNSRLQMPELEEIDALIYHKGLKIFNNQIQVAGGLFSVQTVNRGEVICYSRRAGKNGITGKTPVGLGTQYKIWLPMMENTEQIEKGSSFLSEQVTDGYRAYQNSHTDVQEKLQDILYQDVCADYEINQKDDLTVKNNVLSECREILTFLKREERRFYYFNFENTEFEYAVKMLYFLSLTANEQNIKYMIFYNVDQNDFEQFIVNYRKNIEQKWQCRAQKNYVFIFNKQGTPVYVTNDFSLENSKKLKMYLWAYRGIYYEGVQEAVLSGKISPEEQSAVLLPVEILNKQSSKRFSAPIFEEHMRKLFTTQMSDSDQFGLRYVGHVNLGDKIHVRQYFQGELLFDNNYYLGALAYILARALGNQKRFFLVGYKKYSIGLLNKIKEYMGEQVTGTYIYDKKEQQIDIKDIPVETEIAIVIPIVSTLRTFEKVERFLRGQITGDYQYSYYAFFVSRNQEGPVTMLEREFNWERIERDSIILNSEWPLVRWSEQRRIQYFMMFSGEWQHAMHCTQCDEFINRAEAQASAYPFEALMETGEDSLNLGVKLGIPYNNDPQEMKCYTKMHPEVQQEIYAHMSQYIVEGHYERSENHFKHYLFCGKFFEEYLKDCDAFENWTEKLRQEFGCEDQYVNILLVPEHYSNNLLCKYVNQNVFHENTIIINENFHKEFYSDFTKKYNYLKKLQKVRYIFVDDCVNTGNTWKKVYSLVSGLGKGEKKFYIISLVNRLDYLNKVLLAAQPVKCRFFTEICIPSIKEQDGNCWLCEENKHLKRLYRDTFAYEMKQFYANKMMKTTQYNIDDEDEDSFKTYRRKRKNTAINFLITNELYRQMFIRYDVLQEGRTENFRECFGVSKDYIIEKSIIGTEVDYRYKIAFVKTLSRPFINNFAGLRNFCVNVCMAEFQKLLKEKVETSSEENVLQIKYLIVLIKRFGTLQCRIILGKDCFSKILDFYCKRVAQNEKVRKCNLALHYAVAVKQMMLGSEVNTLKFLENFAGDLLDPGIIELDAAVVKTESVEKEERDLIVRLLRNIFFSEDLIIGNAIRNYKADCEILHSGTEQGETEATFLNNHTYSYYLGELSCFQIQDRKKGEIFLKRIKELQENLSGEAAKNGGMENIGFKNLFTEVLGEIKDFHEYFYRGTKKENYYVIKGRELNEGTSDSDGKTKLNPPGIGVELHEYIEWMRQADCHKIVYQITLNDKNIWISGKNFYFNIAEYNGKNVIGLAFTGETEVCPRNALLMYRLLCGMGNKMIEMVSQVFSTEEHEKGKMKSEEDLRKMRNAKIVKGQGVQDVRIRK